MKYLQCVAFKLDGKAQVWVSALSTNHILAKTLYFSKSNANSYSLNKQTSSEKVSRVPERGQQEWCDVTQTVLVFTWGWPILCIRLLMHVEKLNISLKKTFLRALHILSELCPEGLGKSILSSRLEWSVHSLVQEACSSRSNSVFCNVLSL